MVTPLSTDDPLTQRLPLPLAQLYRRAANAKSPLARHLAAINLWEAALKLLASVALVEYARRPDPDPKLAERLKGLARPALGHWWEFVRLLLPVLAERGDAEFGRLRDLVLGRARDDYPRAAGLDALLREALQGERGGRATVRFTELIERLVTHRNKGPGHGAPAQQPDAHHDRLAGALLAAAAEVLDRLDPLAGRRLLHAAAVSQSGGLWVVQRYELAGESARRLAALDLPREAAPGLPDGDRLYLAAPESCDRPAEWRLLHPLLWYDADAGEVLFLNARRGRRQTEYLSYASGRTLELPDQGREQRLLLARALGMEVAEAEVEAWAGRSQAEEGPAAEGPARGGRSLGEFELLSKLGEGGMGVVYRAWQPSLQRQVALKELRQGGDARTLARFRREIKALGRVEHPNLVKVFTSGAEGERWFYAMELVEGAPLSSVCERLQQSKTSAAEVDVRTWQEAVSTACEEARKAEKPLGEPAEEAGPAARAEQPLPLLGTGPSYVRKAAGLVRQVAEAAHALHQAGVLHRDIKPGNILVTPDGSQAVLMDLGLAQLADDVEGRLTRTRQFVGTLRYASPEQLAGATLDARADVYSLGATLWELLALRPLFGVTEQTPTPDLVLKVQQAEPERLRRVHPRLSRDLEAIAHRCLEKDPRKRYATARDLAEDLGRFLEGRPVRARRVSGLERGLKWARRRPAVAALAAVLVLGAVSLLAGWVWFTVQLDEARRAAEGLAEQEGRHADAEKELRRVAERSADESRRQLGQVSAGRGVQAWQEGKHGEALLHLAAALQFDREDPARARAHQGRLAAFWGRFPRLLKLWPHGGQMTCAAFSPDGTKVVTGQADGTIQLWDVETGRPLLDPPLRQPGAVRLTRVSGDGKHLLTVGKTVFLGKAEEEGMGPEAVRVWDLATRQSVSWSPAVREIRHVSCNHDASRVLVQGPSVYILAFPQAPLLANLRTDELEKGLVYAVLSPDGRRLLAQTTSGKGPGRRLPVQVRDALTGARGATLAELNVPVCALAFSGDGRRCLIVTPGEATVWDAATGKQVARLEHLPAAPASPNKSGPPGAVGPAGVRGGWLNGDGSLVAVDDGGRVVVRDVRTGQVVGPVVRHAAAVEAVHFRPGGQGVVSLTDQPPPPAPPGMLGGIGGQGLPRSQPVGMSEGGLGGEVRPAPPGSGGFNLGGFGGFGGMGGGMFGLGGVGPLPAPGTGEVRAWNLSRPQDGSALPPAPRAGGGPAKEEDWAAVPLGCLASVAGFSPDGRLFLAAGERGLWLGDARVMMAPADLPLALSGDVRAAWFSPTGRHLLVLTAREARLWSLEARAEAGLRLPAGGPVVKAHFSPDGRRVLTTAWAPRNLPWLSSPGAGRTMRVQVWDAATGRPLAGPVTYPHFLLSSYGADGPRVVTAGSEIRVWDPLRGKRVCVMPDSEAAELVLYHAGRRLVVTTAGTEAMGYRPSAARAWDTETGRPLSPRIDLATRSVVAANADAGGRLLVTQSSGEREDEVLVWDLATGSVVGRPLRVPGLVQGVEVTPGGERLLLVQSSRGNLSLQGDQGFSWQLWDVTNGRPITTPEPCSAAWGQGLLIRPEGWPWPRGWFRPDGRRFLTASGRNVVVRDTATGKALRTFRHRGPVQDAYYDGDGGRIITSSARSDADRGLWASASAAEVRAWAADSGEPLIPPAAGDSLLLNGGGERMVVSDRPFTFGLTFTQVPPVRGLRVYQTGPDLPITPPLVGQVFAFSPDGGRLLVATGAEVRVIDLSADRHAPADWGDLARLQAGQDLDRTGAPAALDPGEAGRLWQRLHKGHPECFAVSEAERLAWHRREAQRAEAALDWYGAAWHLDRLVAAVPPEAGLYLSRGLARFELGRLDEAAADLARAAELGPEDWRPPYLLGLDAGRRGRWEEAARHLGTALAKEGVPEQAWRERGKAYLRLRQWQDAAADFERLPKEHRRDDEPTLALLRLQLGDAEGYRKACADLLSRWKGAQRYSILAAEANAIAWACALTSDAGVGPGDLVELATKANEPHAANDSPARTLALALYRAGDFARAVKVLTDAGKLNGEGGTAYEWLLLAMAHHRLGHADEAGRWLGKAAAELDASPPRDWPALLDLPLLRREAETLLAAGRKG